MNVLHKLSKRMSYFDKDIDVVVATHPDADHITGLISVLDYYNVDTILVSPNAGHTAIATSLHDAIEQEHASVHVAARGDVIDFGDGVTMTVLHPKRGMAVRDDDTNDVSVSVVIRYKDQSIVLTGDLPSTYEQNLISDTVPRHVTIYKAGHHGSKYSSGEQFLSYARPEYSIISAGKNNKYDHPNKETLERLATYSKETLSTIDRGTISFFLDGKSAVLRTEK
jgi:competence protein ComEC